MVPASYLLAQDVRRVIVKLCWLANQTEKNGTLAIYIQTEEQQGVEGCKMCAFRFVLFFLRLNNGLCLVGGQQAQLAYQEYLITSLFFSERKRKCYLFMFDLVYLRK